MRTVRTCLCDSKHQIAATSVGKSRRAQSLISVGTPRLRCQPWERLLHCGGVERHGHGMRALSDRWQRFNHSPRFMSTCAMTERTRSHPQPASKASSWPVLIPQVLGREGLRDHPAGAGAEPAGAGLHGRPQRLPAHLGGLAGPEQRLRQGRLLRHLGGGHSIRMISSVTASADSHMRSDLVSRRQFFRSCEPVSRVARSSAIVRCRCSR